MTNEDTTPPKGAATWSRIRAALLDVSDIRFKDDRIN